MASLLEDGSIRLRSRTTSSAAHSPASSSSSPAGRYLNALLSTGRRRVMRRRSWLTWLALLLVVTLTIYFYNDGEVFFGREQYSRPPAPPEDFISPPLAPISGQPIDTHPIKDLIQNATVEFEAVVARQSKTLAEAVTEYRRRYKLAPPPHFDKWFAMAQERGVVLIDEFDSIMDSLRPFWGLPPSVVRGRARESLGYDNFLIDVLIRDGQVTSGKSGWLQTALVGMVQSFVQWLPDMDLPFNNHDEPRVIIPHEDLSRLVQAANEKINSLGGASAAPVTDGWSQRPEDMAHYTRRCPQVLQTRFNRFAQQKTWTSSRISCSTDSPARSLSETPEDDKSSFTYSDLELVSNHTAFSDICNSPSLRKTYGFFDMPNAFDVVHDLFPVFSQSKVSSYQDILFPSPWYWYHKVNYRESQDVMWESKLDTLYWRAGNTGGYSQNGAWRRHHRQQVIRNVNSNGRTRILEQQQQPPQSGEGGTAPSSRWNIKEVAREQFAKLFDVKFVYFAQCKSKDCREQQRYFGTKRRARQEEAWKYKYLLDVDGNAFSGRFYAFLQSMSAIFKVSIFREWHDEDGWLRPWVHYVPLSFTTNEYTEAVRYFNEDDEGKTYIKNIADTSSRWAKKTLSNEMLEVWFFRLLLEYGRVVDDNRDKIGFSL